MAPDPATQLADLVRAAQGGLAGRALSGEVDRRARAVLLDTVGVVIAGGQSDRARQLAVGDGGLHRSWLATERRDDAPARVLLPWPAWASAEHAVLLHGSFGCALELDEGYRPTGHPAIHLVPALLSAGEALDATLGDVLTALVCGYEVAAAMFESFRLGPQVHPHGHIGGVAAAVALAALRGRDALPYAAASATLPLLTLWASCLDGATVRNAWAGQAGASALTAHRLVDSGHRGSLSNLGDALTQLIGHQVGPLEVDPQHPRILNGYFKFHSGCALTHPAVEAALQLPAVGPTAIARVEVVVNANSMRIAALRSDNDLSRRFSVPYAVAAALVHGASGPEVFAELDPVVAALAAKVEVREDPRYTDAWPARSSARVTVTDVGGGTASAECRNPVGSPGDVEAEDGLPAKFARCTGAPTGAWERLASAPAQLAVGDWLAEVVREAAGHPGPQRRTLPSGELSQDRTATQGAR